MAAIHAIIQVVLLKNRYISVMPKRSKRNNYKSGFEVTVARQLKNRGMVFSYEKEAYEYSMTKHYVPDFFLSNGVIIETKGKFTSEDRRKHLCLKEQYPELDIHFVLMRDNYIRKGSRTRYSDWLTKHGFKWALKEIPEQWLLEK